MNKLLITVFVMTLTFFSLSFSDSNGIWTHAEDIKSGVFGDDEIGGDYTFNDIVYFNEDLIYKSELIENLFLNRSGDSMSGTLNMQNNNITNVEMIRGDRVELAGASYIDRVVSQKYFSNGSTLYYLDPANTSKINNLEVVNSLSYKGDELDIRYVNEGQADSINSAMIVDGQVQNQDIATNTITGNRIRSNTITSREINMGELDGTFATDAELTSKTSSIITSCKLDTKTMTDERCPSEYELTGLRIRNYESSTSSESPRRDIIRYCSKIICS